MVIYNDPGAQVPKGRLDDSNRVALVMLGQDDKTSFAVRQIRRLDNAGWTLYGTGGTARFLNQNHVPCSDIADVIGHAPALDHRMASAAWESFSGSISDQNKPAHDDYLNREKIPKFQLIICTVYGLWAEMQDESSTWQSRLEKTDFGGPAALRAASKGRRVIVFQLNQLKDTINRLLAGTIDSQWLENQAGEAEQFCSWYSGISATNISQGSLQTICLKQVRQLRRGENPYQTGAMLMKNAFGDEDSLAMDQFEVVGDTEPGWVNWTDVDRSLNCLTTLGAVLDINHRADFHLSEFAYLGVVVKHGNPVGLAVADNPKEALQLTLTGNQRAAFGGIAMFDFPLDGTLAKNILRGWLPEGEGFRYLAGIVAPSFTSEAIDILRGKDLKKQLLVNPALTTLNRNSLDSSPYYRPVRGGTLVHNGERYLLDLHDDPRLAKRIRSRAIRPNTLVDLLIAWTACATSNSNTTSCANKFQLVGNGVGQQDRVSSCQLAMDHAGDRAIGSAVVTSSFFPKLDGPETLMHHRINTVMYTTGSKADEQVSNYFRQFKNLNILTIADADGRLFFGH